MYNRDEINEVHLNGNIVKVLWRQQQELLKKSPEYVVPIINNENPLDIQIDLEGPKATPYEGGIFRVKLLIPNEFPMIAPRGIFITKIFHPNISEKGEICVNTLKRDWNPRQWSLYNLFEVIKCLLIVPFPQSALNEEAGKLFMENYDEYFKIAQMYTKIYAMKNDNKNTNIVKNKQETNNNTNNNNINNNNANNNDDDFEMEDSFDNNKDNFNIYNSTKNYIHRNNNKFESVGIIDFRRMSEMPKSNYNLNYNCDNETKNNANYQNNLKNKNNNTNNNFGMNDNYINNMLMNANPFNYNQGNNKYNDNLEIKQFLSSKEKPNLSLLPLMNANQIKNNNNNFEYHRSLTNNNISQGNVNGNNNSQEINKWLMRI